MTQNIALFFLVELQLLFFYLIYQTSLVDVRKNINIKSIHQIIYFYKSLALRIFKTHLTIYPYLFFYIPHYAFSKIVEIDSEIYFLRMSFSSYFEFFGYTYLATFIFASIVAYGDRTNSFLNR